MMTFSRLWKKNLRVRSWGNEVYELAHQYIGQLLWGVYAAGISFIASPVFGGGDFGKMVVTDVVYEKVTV